MEDSSFSHKKMPGVLGSKKSTTPQHTWVPSYSTWSGILPLSCAVGDTSRASKGKMGKLTLTPTPPKAYSLISVLKDIGSALGVLA